MKRHIIIYILLGLAVNANAQSDRYGSIYRGSVRFAPGSALLQTDPATGMSYQAVGSPFISTPIEAPLSADNGRDDPREESNGSNNETSPSTISEGASKGQFHASVDLSVMAGFGKGAPHGAGFAQNVDAWYTTPLGKKGWLTAGGYLNHLNWDGINATGGGLYAELGYQFNDHWAAYVYGQKSLVNNGVGGYGYYGYPYYNGYCGNPFYSSWGYGNYLGYNPFGDKFGAAVRWTPNHNFTLEISVEKDWYPSSSRTSVGYRYPSLNW